MGPRAPVLDESKASAGKGDQQGSVMPRLSLWQAAGLQLVPGVATLIAIPLVVGMGVPLQFGLPLAVLLVDVPVSWLVMTRWTRRETGAAVRWTELFPWWSRNPAWVYWVALPAVVFSVAAVGVGMTVLPEVLAPAFAWVPNVYRVDMSPEALLELPRGVLLAFWAMTFVSFTVVGGATQELYSRGFLLPRTAHYGPVAPLLNALWFAVYHLTAPWAWPAFFVMTVVWSYAVWWRRSIRIGLFIHLGMLSVQWMMMTLLVFGLVPVPGG